MRCSDRLSKLTERDDRFIQSKIKENPFESASKIATELERRTGKKVCSRTITNKLKKSTVRLVAAVVNEIAARNFITEFTFFREEVYNIDETSLFWKTLPQKLLIHKKKTNERKKHEKRENNYSILYKR